MNNNDLKCGICGNPINNEKNISIKVVDVDEKSIFWTLDDIHKYCWDDLKELIIKYIKQKRGELPITDKRIYKCI